MPLEFDLGEEISLKEIFIYRELRDKKVHEKIIDGSIEIKTRKITIIIFTVYLVYRYFRND